MCYSLDSLSHFRWSAFVAQTNQILCAANFYFFMYCRHSIFTLQLNSLSCSLSFALFSVHSLFSAHQLYPTCSRAILYAILFSAFFVLRCVVVSPPLFKFSFKCTVCILSCQSTYICFVAFISIKFNECYSPLALCLSQQKEFSCVWRDFFSLLFVACFPSLSFRCLHDWLSTVSTITIVFPLCMRFLFWAISISFTKLK